MTSTSTRRCNANRLGCICTDQASHATWVDRNSRRVRGTELRDGDIVFLAGRWQPLTDIAFTDDSFRATVEGGRMSGNPRSMYAVATR